MRKTNTRQRIFTYGGKIEYILQGIAVFAAIASGVGIALQNLIFGEFVTVIADYSSGVSSPHDFRQDAASLAYVSSVFGCLVKS